MKKVSKKVQSTKLNEKKYFSLNGKMLGKIGGGTITGTGSEDRNCGGCGNPAWYADDDNNS